MSRTKPGSEWYATPRQKRRRKPLAITLSEEERAVLDAYVAEYETSASAVLGKLILEHLAPK